MDLRKIAALLLILAFGGILLYATLSRIRDRETPERRAGRIGEILVGDLIRVTLDCLEKGRELGFRVLQFNAVVESNIHARHLYDRLGFKQLGLIPRGFHMKDGHYENICLYYIEL